MKRAAFVAVLAWTAIVTILRAVRWPNDFAEAHWLLDYRFGFIRRGLAGEAVRRIVNAVYGPVTEALISALAVAVFVLLWLALVAAAVRILQRTAWSGAALLATLAFLSSPFVVLSAHFMGYLDHLVLLLTAAAVLLALRGRTVLSAALMTTAVFVHESAIVVGVPSWAFALWLRAGPGTAPRLRALAPVLVPVAAFAIVALADRAQHRDDVPERISRRLERADFVKGDMHVFVPEWLSESFRENYAVHSRHFVNRMTSAPMYGLVLPALAAMLGFAWQRFRPRAADAGLALAVVVAPLALHLAAFDTARIWSFTIVAGFFSLWILSESQPAGRSAAWPVALLAAAAIVANAWTTSPLMDGQVERFGLGMRLVLYSPTLAAAAWLAVTLSPFPLFPPPAPTSRSRR